MHFEVLDTACSSHSHSSQGLAWTAWEDVDKTFRFILMCRWCCQLVDCQSIGEEKSGGGCGVEMGRGVAKVPFVDLLDHCGVLHGVEHLKVTRVLTFAQSTPIRLACVQPQGACSLKDLWQHDLLSLLHGCVKIGGSLHGTAITHVKYLACTLFSTLTSCTQV